MIYYLSMKLQKKSYYKCSISKKKKPIETDIQEFYW